MILNIGLYDRLHYDAGGKFLLYVFEVDPPNYGNLFKGIF